MGITGVDTDKSLAQCLAHRKHPLIVKEPQNESKGGAEVLSVAGVTGETKISLKREVFWTERE